MRNCNTGALAPQHVLTDDDFSRTIELTKREGTLVNSMQAPSPPLLAKRSMPSGQTYGSQLLNDTSHSGWPTLLWIADVLMLLKRLARIQHTQRGRDLYFDVAAAARGLRPHRSITRHAALALPYVRPAPIPSHREIPRAAFGRIASFDTAVALADRASDAAANHRAPVIDLPHTRDWLNIRTRDIR